MAFDKQELYDKAIKAINEHELIFIEDVISYLPCSKPTFYSYFKVDSNDFNNLKEEIEKNKISLKVKLRKKWLDSEAAPLQLALYKLLANPEEHKALSMQNIDHTTQGESINIISLGSGKKPDETS